MKLRTQILGLGLAGAALAAGVGGLGLLSTGRLGQSMQSAVQAGEALQASQEADMMHDAIRGDALRAMLAMLEKQTDDAAEAAKALKEHVQTFDKALAHLGELPLTDETRRQLESVRPLVQRYEQVADATIAQWRAGDPAARATTQALQQAFTQLETAMASLSDSIEKHNDALKDDAGQNVRRTGLALGAALATITALMLAASLLLARRMAAPIDKAGEAAERLAQGDLSGHIRPSGNDESRQLLTAMARMQTELTGIIGAVKSGAEQVATASAQIAKGNEELAGRTGQQAGSLDTSADTVRHLGESVRSNADHAAQADTLAQGASRVAAQGGEVMNSVVSTMTGINDSARQIASIIGTIDGIAFQTNILALNAAVEAARAGEQGRGFAVVAGEVRSLAQRSAAAAREVKSLVNASVERVDQGTALVGEAGRTMAQIVESIGRVTTIVGEISHASARQGEDVRQVNEAIGFLGQRTQDNAALVQDSAMAADSLRQQAEVLVSRVAAFKLA